MVATSVDPYILFDQARQQGPNPFRQKPIVSKDEVWGEVMTDLSTLNEHVDNNIHQAISDVRNKYTHKIGIVVKGDVGTGKSHVIHRIRKTIERQNKCMFAYIPPYNHASRINSHVRLYLALSLNERDSSGTTQWQKLAAAVIKTLEGTDFEEKYQKYLDKCAHPDELRKYILTIHKRDELVEFFDGLVEAILENQPKLDFNFLKAALFLLLKTAPLAQVGLAWMIGEDFPGTKEAGLTEFSSEQHEGKSTWMIQQICGLAEVISSPMLICFDQLDCAPVSNDSGDSPAMIVAKCIDQIYFQCSNVILLCCAISTMWSEIVELGGGISERVGERSVSTKPPNAEQMLDLVRLRLDWFYNQKGLDSTLYPDLYPFSEGEIRKLSLKATGSRDLMKWCAEKFESASDSVDTSLEIDPLEKRRKEFLEVYKELLQRRISIPVDDDDKLGSVISIAMKMIPSGGTADVIVTDVKPFNSPSYAVHMIISGYDSLHNKKVEIGVRICQTKVAKTFNAVMKRLVDYEKYQLTRGCLIRSAPVPSSWRVGTQLKQQLEKIQGGEVVTLKKDEIKPLVVVQRIYEEAGNNSETDGLNGFTKEEVINFVKELRLVADNPLVCEILSAPVAT